MNNDYSLHSWTALNYKAPTFWYVRPKISETEMRRCTGSKCGSRFFPMRIMSVGRQKKSNGLVYMCDECLARYKGNIEFEKVTPEVE